MLTRAIYKFTSILFFAISVILLYTPQSAVKYLIKVPDSSLHPLVELTLNLLAAACFILSACVCTATTSSSSLKSTGAGLLVGGLLLLIPYRSISPTYLADQRILLGSSLYLSMTGAMGLATGISENAHAYEEQKSKSKGR